MRGKFAGAAGATAMSGDAFLVVGFLLGYLLGSIPFGLVLTKLAGTQDLRSIGSVYIGVLIGLFWPAALIFCAMWLATAFTTRYSSLSALVAAFITPLFLWWFGHPALASLFVVLTLLLFWKHTENIKRLQTGTEGRIGAK